MKSQLLLILILLVTACAPPQPTAGPDSPVTSPPNVPMPTNEPSTNPFAPQPGDADLTRGTVYLTDASLVVRESFPPQVSLHLSGDLPTPCNQLRLQVDPPDAENRIVVDVYSVVDPNQICIQVLEPFDESIDLGTFPSGHYAVWANGQTAGEFDT